MHIVSAHNVAKPTASIKPTELIFYGIQLLKIKSLLTDEAAQQPPLQRDTIVLCEIGFERNDEHGHVYYTITHQGATFLFDSDDYDTYFERPTPEGCVPFAKEARAQKSHPERPTKTTTIRARGRD